MLRRKNSSLKFLLFTILATSICACYKNEEACLNPKASNYDVTADIACDDCCTFPQLSLLISHSYGDATYSKVDTVLNDIGVPFVIEDVQTYFSEISINTDTETFGISETINITDQTGTDQQITNDILLSTPSTYRHTIGTFSHVQYYTDLNITLGVPTDIDLAQSITVPADHPLAIAGDSLYINNLNQYVKSWIVIRQIGVHTVADTLQIDQPSYVYSFGDFNKDQVLGSSLNVNLNMDYKIMIQGIDYNTMSKAEIIDKIGDNLTQTLLSNF